MLIQSVNIYIYLRLRYTNTRIFIQKDIVSMLFSSLILNSLLNVKLVLSFQPLYRRNKIS